MNLTTLHYVFMILLSLPIVVAGVFFFDRLLVEVLEIHRAKRALLLKTEAERLRKEAFEREYIKRYHR